MTAFGKGQTVVSEETLREKHANRTGELIGLRSGEESPTDRTSREMSLAIRRVEPAMKELCLKISSVYNLLIADKQSGENYNKAPELTERDRWGG
ncbi:hypothetical protein ACLOJK_020151 [Asimina triloba]